MIDYFALFDEPRRPWLDSERLKQKFLAVSGQIHPDRVHHQGGSELQAAHDRYIEMNAAYQCLREPQLRLRHLLELERGAVPEDVQRIPPKLTDLFMEIGQACHHADRLLSEKAATTSPLLKVQQFQLGQEWTERLLNLQRKLGALTDQLTEELKRLDAEWESGTPTAIERAVLSGRLEELCRLFGFFGRWQKQLQERIVPLSL